MTTNLVPNPDPAVVTWTAALDLREPKHRGTVGRIPGFGTIRPHRHAINNASCVGGGAELCENLDCPACAPHLYSASYAKHRSDQ